MSTRKGARITQNIWLIMLYQTPWNYQHR